VQASGIERQDPRQDPRTTPNERAGEPPRVDGPGTRFGSVMQGYTEASNVNIVEEMVNLITAQRAYEINSKSIQSSDEMLQNIAQLKR